MNVSMPKGNAEVITFSEQEKPLNKWFDSFPNTGKKINSCYFK